MFMNNEWSWRGAAVVLWTATRRPVGNGAKNRASRPSQGTVNGGAVSK